MKSETSMVHLKPAGSKAGIPGRGFPTRELNVFIVEASSSAVVTQVTHTQDSIMTEHPQKPWKGKVSTSLPPASAPVTLEEYCPSCGFSHFYSSVALGLEAEDRLGPTSSSSILVPSI